LSRIRARIEVLLSALPPEQRRVSRVTNELAIHVAIVFSSGEIGGAERSLTLMAGANSDSAIRYSLWSLGRKGQWHQWAEKQGLDPQSRADSGWRLAWVLRLLLRLRRTRPGIVYAVGLRAYVLMRLASPWFPGLLVVHAIRTSFPPSDPLTRRYAWAERLFFSPADAYVANSHAGMESFLRITPRGRDRMSCIPNGVVVPDSVEQEATGNGVLVLANMHPLKDHLPFLDVVREVTRRDPSAYFFFVGRDEMNGQVRRRAAELGVDSHIEFAGFMADPSGYFVRSRLFALPSRTTEGAPTSILEAHARGLPVVAYAVGGVAELVRHEIDGLLVNRDQPAGMVDAILSLLHDPGCARRLGSAGRDRVRNELSLAACAREHASLWHRLSNFSQGTQQ
jgi:glycosyltransferase involved in cell wall biosynthesis